MQNLNSVKLLMPKSDSGANSQLPAKKSANPNAKVTAVPQERKPSVSVHVRRMARLQSEECRERKAKWQAKKQEMKTLRLEKIAQQKKKPAFKSAVGGAKGKSEKPWQKRDRNYQDVIRDARDFGY